MTNSWRIRLALTPLHLPSDTTMGLGQNILFSTVAFHSFYEPGMSHYILTQAVNMWLFSSLIYFLASLGKKRECTLIP